MLPVSIVWIWDWRGKIISFFVGRTAVLTTFKVFQIKFFYAFPVGHKTKFSLVHDLSLQ